MTNLLHILAGLLLMASTSSLTDSGEEMAADRPLVTLWGADSTIDEVRYERVTSAERWRALYLEHMGLEPEPDHPDWAWRHYNPHGLPDVDFERCMVIAVFKGDGWNNAGVTIESIDEDEQRVLVRYRDHFYQTEGPDGGGQRVAPYGIFIVPRSEKEVILEEMVQNMQGEPPTWKEVVRFAAAE